MDKKTNAFPISHVVGFVISLVLTLAAAGIALKTNLSFKVIMMIIGTLAVLQAALQLTMFMHMNEGEDGKTQTINVIYGIFTAIIIVAGTVWVMSFGMHSH
ncbi:cytochrome aa3 quinol oxidase subunit IV [Bacillus canaveralius]|uniref:Quinol oxidase subunit 4 n=1 Tax=Bacillus canaveralius TaxID=1403243 RepID=A0A2N5GS22_9BACI|nr:MULTISPECIES: cytochrome aa3 quinol oxidase subunit IV [Bacillus]PLR86360.1 cytochrome aa3 quinol oxidase subunit IV [Bacillus canaveralius]PLR86609.1 cytochrome aa3 quinol oxidase subunit IV [Bacillus sp. V33-4]PLR98593.1 cytochrome aa3 quinol oxidase subunit IV [Bacillus canaveralius]RSK53970.1 cytochrome aa3 quinol oxidase subunit IV [Bacillus canaveralius]